MNIPQQFKALGYSSTSYRLFIFLLLKLGLLVNSCRLFNDGDPLIQCADRDLSRSALVASISNGYDSYLINLSAEDLSENYRIEGLWEAPFYTNHDDENFFYTYSTSPERDLFVLRRIATGSLVDSLSVPKGTTLFKMDDVYISYGASNTTTIVDNGAVITKDFGYLIQPIQRVENTYYAVYGTPSNTYFGTIDTSGVSQEYDLTDIISSVLPALGFVYDMYYIEEENSLLITVEDALNPPSTILFDIDLSSGEYSFTQVGDHANIFKTADHHIFLLSHTSTLLLSSNPKQYLKAYDTNKNSVRNLLNLKSALGEDVYIQDIATDGCSLFAGIILTTDQGDATSMIIKIDLGRGGITDSFTIHNPSNAFSSIVSLSINSNPKQNAGLK